MIPEWIPISGPDPRRGPEGQPGRRLAGHPQAREGRGQGIAGRPSGVLHVPRIASPCGWDGRTGRLIANREVPYRRLPKPRPQNGRHEQRTPGRPPPGRGGQGTRPGQGPFGDHGVTLASVAAAGAMALVLPGSTHTTATSSSRHASARRSAPDRPPHPAPDQSSGSSSGSTGHLGLRPRSRLRSTLERLQFQLTVPAASARVPARPRVPAAAGHLRRLMMHAAATRADGVRAAEPRDADARERRTPRGRRRLARPRHAGPRWW